MSAINGATSVLYPQLNALTATDPSQQSTESAVITAFGQESGGQTSVVEQGHHHKGQTNPLFGQVQQSVSSALQTAQGNSSADPNQIIEQAISSVIQQNGGSAIDPDGDGDGGASSGTAAAGSTSGTTSTQQTFANTLKSYGIDPQQFRNDFLAAIKQAQGGQGDSSTAFSSFPSGLTFDTTG